MAQKKREKKPSGTSGTTWTAPPRAEASPGFRRVTEVGAAKPTGRAAIAVLLVLSFMSFGAFLFIRNECRSQISTLRDSGVHAVATVTKAPVDKFDQIDNATVRFATPQGDRTAGLCSPSGTSLPRNLAAGVRVPVTYSSRNPTQAMLTSQVDSPPAWSFLMVIPLVCGTFFLAGAVAGAVRRRRLSGQDKPTG